MTGSESAVDEPSPLFRLAPQRSLYPEFGSRPSVPSIVKFLNAHRIDYIYADDSHPNRLDPDASVIVEAGEFKLLEVRQAP